MFVFILAVIVLVAGIIGLFAPKQGKLIGVGLIAFSVLLLVLSSTNIVSARNTGVKVTFGKVSDDTLSPGLAVTAPWTKVVEVDGALQTNKFVGDNCVPVRIGDGSMGCLGLTVQWEINGDAANDIYKDFRDDDPVAAFRDAVVMAELEASVTSALSTYNPLSQLDVVKDNKAAASDMNFTPDFGELSKAIGEDMTTRLGERARVDNVIVQSFSMSESTQKKLNDFIAAVGETRVAMQKKETASAQAEANKVLSGSVSNNPNVLVSRCLDTLNEGMEKGYQFPAGFSCWGAGANGTVLLK